MHAEVWPLHHFDTSCAAPVSSCARQSAETQLGQRSSAIPAGTVCERGGAAHGFFQNRSHSACVWIDWAETDYRTSSNGWQGWALGHVP